jgi:hypothetical protein
VSRASQRNSTPSLLHVTVDSETRDTRAGTSREASLDHFVRNLQVRFENDDELPVRRLDWKARRLRTLRPHQTVTRRIHGRERHDVLESAVSLHLAHAGALFTELNLDHVAHNGRREIDAMMSFWRAWTPASRDIFERAQRLGLIFVLRSHRSSVTGHRRCLSPVVASHLHRQWNFNRLSNPLSNKHPTYAATKAARPTSAPP